MKRLYLIAILSLMFICYSVYAADIGIFETRNKIFDESNQIRAMLPDAANTLLMMTMWDTCSVAIKQVDAYFYMVRIFETIKPEDVKSEAVLSLVNWLGNMKKTNEVNIDSIEKMMANSKGSLDAASTAHMNRLKELFKELDNNINTELKKLNETKRP